MPDESSRLRDPQVFWWRGYLTWLTLALLAGAALRAWFLLHAPQVSDDGVLYGNIARNWFWHGIYGISRGSVIRPTLIRLPGYPLFLAACFALFGLENYRAVMMVHVVVDLASCCLVAATASRQFGPRAGRIALWLAVLCPFTANYIATALTETLSIFCVALAFYALLRWQHARLAPHRWAQNRWVLLITAALAYATLLRPEQGLLTAAIIPAMGLATWRTSSRRQRFLPVIAAAVLAVLPLGPWAIRNWRTFHVVQPLAPRNANDPGEPVPLGFQRWFRTFGVDYILTDQVYWRYDNDIILVTDLPSRAFDTPDQNLRTSNLLAEYNLTTSASPAFNQRFAELAQERITGHRWRYFVALPLARLVDMLIRPRTELLLLPLDWWRWHLHPTGSNWAIAFLVLNAAYFAFAAAGLARQRSNLDSTTAAMVLFWLLRCAMLATIDNSEPRYTLELFPILIVWAASAIAGRSWGSSRA